MLVADDDATVADVVARYLDARASRSRSWATAKPRSTGHSPTRRTSLVLDLMLPGIDGLEVCRRLRALAPVPVIMLTAKGDEADRVIGLELGADDYVAKPFSPKELTAAGEGRAAPGQRPACRGRRDASGCSTAATSRSTSPPARSASTAPPSR